MHALTQLIREDMKPALGVTEPGAIALAVSTACSHLPAPADRVELSLNSGIYKNAFACGIPGTSHVGNAYAAALGVQCYHPFWGSLTDDTVADLKAHHLKINTFTVNDEAAIRSLLAKGVDCVIGNFPDLTAAVLAG